MSKARNTLSIGTISEPQVASVLQSPGRQLRHHHVCSVHDLCALCQETASHFQYAELETPASPDGPQPESTRVAAHDVWHLLLESPLAHTSVTLRQRLHLRSLVLPPPSALHPAEAPAQLVMRKGVWLWRDQVDATPLSASGTITPAASAAAVPGYEDTPPDRIRRALNGEGNGPSRLGPDDHVRRMFACRDALVAAAEHGDTDALTLLVRHTVFRSYAFGPHAAVSRDIMLADLIWAFCGGRIAPELLGWMFGDASLPEVELEMDAPFAEWLDSDVPYLAAAMHLHNSAVATGTTPAPDGGSGSGSGMSRASREPAADGAAADGISGNGYDSRDSPLSVLREFGFAFHESGRTFLLAVWLYLHDRCSEAAIGWLAQQGCPTGPPGWAYALVAGLQPSTEWSRRQEEALAVLAEAHVPLGPAALADIWRLGPKPFSSYVGFLAKQRCPGVGSPRLYAAASCCAPFNPASRADARARRRFLKQSGLAPPRLQRLCGVLCVAPPAADGFAGDAAWDDAGSDPEPDCSSGGTEASNASADGGGGSPGAGGSGSWSRGGGLSAIPRYGSREVTKPLLEILEGVPAECLVVGGPAASQSNVSGALAAALQDLQLQDAIASGGGGRSGAATPAASVAVALHARQLRQHLQAHLQRRDQRAAQGMSSSQSDNAMTFSSGGSEAVRSQQSQSGEVEGERGEEAVPQRKQGDTAGGSGEFAELEPAPAVALEGHNPC